MERERREVSGNILAGFLLYVVRARGMEAAERVAGTLDLSVAEITNDRWFTGVDAARVARAAASECGDPDIGRRAGEATFWHLVESGVTDLIVATGSPTAALVMLTEYAGRTSTTRRLDVIEQSDNHVIIEGEYSDTLQADRVFCAFPAAFFSLVPTLFGAIGTGVETECQLSGAPRCRFDVRWQQSTYGKQVDVDASQARMAETITSFERLRHMAAELASADDASAALAQITKQAHATMNAPRYLLGVTLHDGETQRLHHFGFPPSTDVHALAPRVFAGERDVDGYDPLVVDLTSPRRAYGKLAALFPAGRTFLEIDRRLFEAYAAHAAAELDSLVALDAARRHRDTSSALLQLARALAEVTTSDQMAERLSSAIVPVLSCTSSSIWLARGAGFALAAVGGAGRPGVVATGLHLTGDDVTAMAVASMAGQPVIVAAEAAPAPLLASMGDGQIARVAIAPIVVRQEVIGLAVAGFIAGETATGDDHLLERLTAMTDHAATALDNARLLERVHHDALHDTLTGLPNRALIEDRVATALRRGDRTDRWPSLLFVDLDRFKNVNDTLGHRAGDDLIRQVGARLCSIMRDADTLGRLGGDEFVVLVEDLDGTLIPTAIAERIGEALRAPFDVDGRELFISCSIGIASAPSDGSSYELLLQHADAAMYEAKDGGRATYAVYAPLSSVRRERLEIESRLHRAIENGELVLLYQPQVDLRTNKAVGAEALVRWDHPDLGRLGPDRFLPVAEESGLIVDIDRWVRATAFAEARRWLDEGLDLRVAVNLSTRELQKRGLADDIAAEVAAAGLLAGLVEVEITDRVVIADDESLPLLVRRLHDVGLRVAVDDFGTGTSVLGRLGRCAFDTLKVDRSFVREIGTADGDTIARAIVSLGRSLDLEVVAEGIETPLQLERLRGLGCPIGQGYLLSMPIEGAALAAFARATNGYARTAESANRSAKLLL